MMILMLALVLLLTWLALSSNFELGRILIFMISRGFTWIDESIEHSDANYARANALAAKWSSLKTEEENRHFDRMARSEDYDAYDPYEDCECEYCLKNNHRCNNHQEDGSCTLCAIETNLTDCESRIADEKRNREIQAERDLEIELIEDKLQMIGARMMRPYEHWNEDERYMQYMEDREY